MTWKIIKNEISSIYHTLVRSTPSPKVCHKSIFNLGVIFHDRSEDQEKNFNYFPFTKHNNLPSTLLTKSAPHRNNRFTIPNPIKSLTSISFTIEPQSKSMSWYSQRQDTIRSCPSVYRPWPCLESQVFTPYFLTQNLDRIGWDWRSK